MKSWIFIPAATVLAASVAGCLATNQPREATVGQTTTLVESDGVVVVQVAVNGDQISDRFGHWHVIMAREVRDLQNPDQQRQVHYLRPVNRVSAGAHIYAGTLPEGTYRLTGFFSLFNDGNYVEWMRAPMPPHIGEFEVGFGQLTDLGALVYQPVPIEGGNGFLVARTMRHASNPGYLDARFANVARQIVQGEVLGWRQPELDAVNDALLAAILPRAQARAPLAFLDDGRVVRPARLGQLLVRELDGTWGQIDTGLDSTITSFIHIPGDAYYVTSEAGHFFRADSLDGPWTARRLATVDSVVLGVTRSASGVLHVMATASVQERVELHGRAWTEQRDYVRVYAEGGDGEAWESVWQHRLPTLGMVPDVFVEGETFVVSMKGRGITRYDTTRRSESRQRRTPTLIQPGPDGLWTGLRLGVRPGRHAGFISADGGRTWDAYRDQFFYAHGWPARLPDGTVVMAGRGFLPASSSQRIRESDDPIQLHRYLGIENEWEPWQPLPAGCGGEVRLQLQADTDLWITCDDGAIYRLALARGEMFVERLVDLEALAEWMQRSEDGHEPPDEGDVLL